MKTALRAILYVVSTKQGRHVATGAIAGIVAIIAITAFIIQGFFITYFSAFGGTDNDVYVTAINEVKDELNIENNLEPSILRAINYKQKNTVDAEKNDIINLIKQYFIKQESVQRTVTQDDIDNQQLRIDELAALLNSENEKDNPNYETVSYLTEEINIQTVELEKLQNIYDSEADYKYSFLSLDEIKYMLSNPPFSFEDKYINEIEQFVFFQQNANINFDNITFDNETTNEKQKKIVSVATSASEYGIYASEGKCQKWVADIYSKVLGTRGHAESAISAGHSWSVSNDWSTIQIGATVYGTASNKYGHVGIYIGNGNVIHNLDGYVKTQSLESWVKQYNGKCWGWENGKNLTDNPIYNCIGGLI